MAATIQNQLVSSASETASGASFRDDSKDTAALFSTSGARLNALVLESLITVQPANPLIPKIVRSLMLSRRKNGWQNTNEDSFCLLALSKYFSQFEGEKPDFVCNLWLGKNHVMEQNFTDRSPTTIDLLLSAVNAKAASDQSADQQVLTLDKEGTGRLYYRIGMQYYLPDTKPAAIDRGFNISRSYEALPNSTSDVRVDDKGVVHVKNGATVRVRIQFTIPGERHYIALVDSLPAGFEALNLQFKGSDQFIDQPVDYASGKGEWWPQWYDYENLRDDRVEAFASDAAQGTYEYSYLVHATTSGAFNAAPTKIEEMYAPETFGRGNSDRVIVE